MDFGLIWGVGEPSTLSHILAVTWRIFLVLIGVNALIIVHEFGHFIVARLCGVRCDKFYIWFDAYDFRLFRFRWGKTEYGLGWLPLGGYVKMLGQEDNPAGIKEEIERAKKEAETSEEAKKELEEKEKRQEELYAPDSYLSKNVFQRMAIISAGVVMNVLFAIFCAAWAAMIGFPVITSRIGMVLPDTPAWSAGLKSGDKVVKLNDQPTTLFSDIPLAMLDAKPVAITVEREVNGTTETIEKTVTPVKKEGQMTPTIGVLYSNSLDLSPFGKPYQLTLDGEQNRKLADLFASAPKRGRLVAMNGTPVTSPADYQRILRESLTRPITFEFAETDKQGGLVEATPRFTVELPPDKGAETGVRLTMGEITALADHSPAADAGLKVQVRSGKEITQHGDIPVAINNEPITDPLLFPFQIYQLAGQSGGTSEILLTVKRDGENLDIPITLAGHDGMTGLIPNGDRLASAELGISYEILPTISGTDAAVSFPDETNPIGAAIQTIETVLSEPAPDANEEIKALYQELATPDSLGTPDRSGKLVYKVNDPSGESNPSKVLYWFTQMANYLPDGTPVRIHYVTPRGDEAVCETSITRPGNLYRLSRGIHFDIDSEIVKANGIGAAIATGWDKTLYSMGMIYRSLKNIGRNISAKAFSGPVGIVNMAYQSTGTHDGSYLLFLCLIGANLAVVNILPIPVLDGGHLVFLLYEMIFRKKPNENIQIILSYIGLFLLLALMVWVILLDISRLMGWM